MTAPVVPTRMAHGLMYKLVIGWWWTPAKFVGRVFLWIFALPLGVWRSVVNNRKKRDSRYRRGAKKAQ